MIKFDDLKTGAIVLIRENARRGWDSDLEKIVRIESFEIESGGCVKVETVNIMGVDRMFTLADIDEVCDVSKSLYITPNAAAQFSAVEIAIQGLESAVGWVKVQEWSE